MHCFPTRNGFIDGYVQASSLGVGIKYAIYIDDFMHENGYYRLRNMDSPVSLSEFLCIPNESYILIFRSQRLRGDKRVLTTKSGEWTICEQQYKDAVSRMCADCFQDFYSCTISGAPLEFIDNLGEVNGDYVKAGTFYVYSVLNKLLKENSVLAMDGRNGESKDYDMVLGYPKGYLRYLVENGQLNATLILSRFNCNALASYISRINESCYLFSLDNLPELIIKYQEEETLCLNPDPHHEDNRHQVPGPVCQIGELYCADIQ